jgi:uncharacterized membrane protein
MSETKYERLTWLLADAQDTVTDCNIHNKADVIEHAKALRNLARRNIERELEAKDALIEELLAALESIENDDGRIPQAIWDMRNAAIAKARQ